MRQDGRALDASADVPRLREDRLLRQLAEPSCLGALRRDRTSADPLRGAVRGLALVLRRPGSRLRARRVSSMTQPRHDELVAAIDVSALALRSLALHPDQTSPIGAADVDTVLYVSSGSGRLVLGDVERSLAVRSAALVLAGEEATVVAEEELSLVVATVGPDVDLHAPMGRRDVTVSLAGAGAEKATGARSFQVLFGPHKGSTRATLFAG